MKEHRNSIRELIISLGRVALLVVLVLLIIDDVSDCSSSPTTKSSITLTRPTITRQPTTVVPQRFVIQGIYVVNGSLYMVSEQVGWARSYIPTGSGSLFRTTDGGKGWKQITLPQEPAGWDFLLNVFDEDLAFLQPFQPNNTDTVFLDFYRTVDGGTTWQHCNWPTTPAITRLGVGAAEWIFLDHMHGWVVLSPLHQSTDKMLFHTNDGGQSWQPVVHLPLSYAGSLTFIDSQTGSFSTALDGSTRADVSAVLYVTHDGGYTWKESSALPLPSQETSKPSTIDTLPFFTRDAGYFTVSFGKTDAHIARYLYATRDGGNTWQIEGTALPTSPSYVLNVVDTTHINDGSYLFTLTNGQWVKTSQAPVEGDVSRWRVEFLSPKVGVALVDDTNVYKTSDGGQNWRQVSTLPKS